MSSDTAILNRSGDGVNPNSAFNHGQACPSEVSGNQTVSDLQGQTFLTNAIESPQDIIPSGEDNDGLCESFEGCIYQPNFGAYFGDSITLQPCIFTDGAVSAVNMYGATTNGL